MEMRGARLMILLALVRLLPASAPPAGSWVPMRWTWSDPQSLDLLTGTPINCLLLPTISAGLIHDAEARGLVALALIAPDGDPVAAARAAVAAHATGLVLEGDFSESAVAAVHTVAADRPVIELTSRGRMPLGSNAAILGTWQGVWPGIPPDIDGAHRAGPTGSVWIDTNTGFIRAVRAEGRPALWIANTPPPHTVITVARYEQVIADAAISGARWVVALDSDLSERLHAREPGALAAWGKISQVLGYFEGHPEWRAMREYGKLAVVQDPAKGALVSGGILDMIAVKHTPVRAVPPETLSPEALAGATMAVDVDAESLSPAQREILRNFARSGGTLLTGPPGWEDRRPSGGRITLDPADLAHINDIWRDVNALIGHSDQGIRLFNVSSMLSNVLVSTDGKTEIVHLVNYADYPVESVTVHFAGGFKHATLLSPDSAAKPLEIYKVEEGSGVDIDKVAVCATIKLEY
jgi:hypothetical protein